MNIDKSCHNSSCEPTATGRRSKKRSRIYRMRTESLTTDSFFDLSFWCIGIPNGFASVTACGCLGSDCPVICRYLVYIYCPKESKCRHLQNPSKIPLSCQGTIKIKNKNQKTNPWSKTPLKIRDAPWAFFDLSSVAAGSQSARQQWEWRNNVRRPKGKYNQ